MHFPTIVVGSMLSVAFALPTTTLTSFERREIAERQLSSSLTAALEQALNTLNGVGGAEPVANEGAVKKEGEVRKPHHIAIVKVANTL
jgi:hypothetical protein